MADTLPLVECPHDVWVNAYAETGIVVGTPLVITVFKSKSKMVGSISALEPSSDDLVVPLPPTTSGMSAVVTAGESGFWLKSNSGTGFVSVQDGS